MDDVIVGMLAAFGSVLFFGSYAVPIKMPAALSLDPFVFQSYKSTACFMTSWLVLLYTPYRFTWWGMLGALIWVTNGVVAISAVRWAGIGIAQSLWSGLSCDIMFWMLDAMWRSRALHMSTNKSSYKPVFIAYIWGAYVFREPLKNHFLSLLALLVMALGMIGIGIAVSGEKSFPSLLDVWFKLKSNFDTKNECSPYSCIKVEDSSKPLIMGGTPETGGAQGDCDHQKYKNHSNILKGVLCAILVGTLNGSFMIPLKYANKDVVGVEYLVSFGIGAMTVTLMLLVIYVTVLAFYRRPLPSLYVPGAAGPAFLAGLLWSLGNFFSIYATLDLGVALGWPLVQCQLLVSAMWAVFFYKEVTTKIGAALLIGSSILVVSGAIAFTIRNNWVTK